MLLVARIDALGAVAGEEVDIEAQARHLLEHRHADFLGGAGVNGGFVDDDIALLEHLADGLRGLHQRGEVGLLVLVDRGRHGDDERIAGGKVVEVRAIGQPAGVLQLFVADLQGGIVTGPERGDALLADVEARHRAMLAEFNGERQADVAEADDGEFDVVRRMHGGRPDRGLWWVWDHPWFACLGDASSVLSRFSPGQLRVCGSGEMFVGDLPRGIDNQAFGLDIADDACSVLHALG
ncbi:hypothetical protein D9M71_441960 [compost metagenome]